MDADEKIIHHPFVLRHAGARLRHEDQVVGVAVLFGEEKALDGILKEGHLVVEVLFPPRGARQGFGLGVVGGSAEVEATHGLVLLVVIVEETDDVEPGDTLNALFNPDPDLPERIDGLGVRYLGDTVDDQGLGVDVLAKNQICCDAH